METIEQTLEAYKAVKAPPKAGQEAVRKGIKDKRDVLREVESSIGVAEKDIAFMRKVLDALAKPVCPISNKLVCSTDKTGIRSELEAGVKEKEKIVSAGHYPEKNERQPPHYCMFPHSRHSRMNSRLIRG